MLYDPNWQPKETTTEEWRTIIDKAADLIEKGWVQRAYHIKETKWFGLREKHSYCIVGALRATNAGEYLRDKAYTKIREHLGKQPEHWNDARGRTKDEVVGMLRTVARS